MLRFVLIPCLLAPGMSWAQSAPPPELGSSLLQMILGLAVVLVLVVASLWVIKRISGPRGAASTLLRVVAGTSVGPRERVVILEIGSTWLVLGVAPGRVSALAEIPRQSLPAPPEDADARKDFAGWLKQMMDRRHGA